MMNEWMKLSDKVKAYAEERAAAVRLGRWLLILSVFLPALSRSPDFQLGDAVLRLVKGPLDSGYVTAYGHFIVLAVAYSYASAVCNCARLQSAVRRDIGEPEADESMATERYLLRPPFCAEATRYAKPACLGPLFPLVAASLAYAFMLGGYFQFYKEGRKDDRWHDLFFGSPDQGGFHGKLDLGVPSQPWINAPWQTYFGILCAVILLVLVVKSYRQIVQNYAPLATSTNRSTKRTPEAAAHHSISNPDIPGEPRHEQNSSIPGYLLVLVCGYLLWRELSRVRSQRDSSTRA
jgi:hypothetical protein